MDLLIPLTLFICLAYTITAIVDSYTRRRIAEARGSEELIRAFIDGEAANRLQMALHRGCVLVALGLGFALIAQIGWKQITPAAIAVLLVATGLGNFISYGLQRKFKQLLRP
jgi:putative exporter of polyketide antibiotics